MIGSGARSKRICTSVLIGAALCAIPTFGAAAKAATLSGPVNFVANVGVSCVLTANLNGATLAGSTFATLSFSGDFPCSFIVFSNDPYVVTLNGSIVSFENTYVSPFATNDCAGDLHGVYDAMTGTITFDATLPRVDPADADCTIQGIIS